jgi:hypothetical protein
LRRYDAEEEPMTDLAARFVYSPLLSTAFKVVVTSIFMASFAVPRA